MNSKGSSLTIVGGSVLSGGGVLPDGAVIVRGGKISYVGPSRPKGETGERVIHAGGNYVGPGFIDLHVHGAAGAHFLDGSSESGQKISAAHARYGTTTLLATLSTAPLDMLRQGIACLRQLIEEGQQRTILGIHLEGPYINPAQRGVHPPQHVRMPDTKEFLGILDCAGGALKLVTLAPELEGAIDLIQLLRARGIVVAAGHSNANARECEAAFDAGVSYVTHLFNAMSGMHHRTPGLAAAALVDERISVELISDGVHVHPLMLRLALKAKGWERVVLVTDCIKALDFKGEDMQLGGSKISMRGGAPHLDNGTLCGTVLTMNRAVRNVREFTGASIAETVRLATINPARILGIEGRKGSVDVGKDADLVIFDDEMDVKATIIGGEVVYNTL